jgi:hypothetical protein
MRFDVINVSSGDESGDGVSDHKESQITFEI